MKAKSQKQMRVEAAVLIVVWQMLDIKSAATHLAGPHPVRIAKHGCKDRCGNASIPYPFGIGPNCYHDPWFEVECNQTTGKLTFKKVAYFDREENQSAEWTPQISWENGRRTVTIKTVGLGFAFYDHDGSTFVNDEDFLINLEGSPFLYSRKYNILVVSGCGGATMLVDRQNKTLAGCAAFCVNGSKPGSDCFGIGCCQATISRSFNYYSYSLSALVSKDEDSFNWAMLVERNWVMNKRKYIIAKGGDLGLSAPVVLEWTIKDLEIHHPKYANSSCVNKTASADDDGGLVCRCKYDFYEGNPYLPYGCKVVKECEACVEDCTRLSNHAFTCPANSYPSKREATFSIVLGLGLSVGSMLALFGAYWFYQMIKRKKNLKLKAIYFERNGGMLLKQQMSSFTDYNIEKVKIFSSDELEKATDHYNEDRILGQGGQGTVYKGMLGDGRIVAIKKSTKVCDRLLNVFINEVVLLSQINHRNVVNLLGCCLESEVPILVYEYVPCGTLAQHIHAPQQDFPIAWEMRLQIATDIANALAYLHSSYFVPIFHRDIKSDNILLDERYRAKLSDFGISKSVKIDETHVTTTHVIGTIGYLDPEYFHSYQFTDKSDVYSFGVVLVELLTGEKAVRGEDDEKRGLVAWFLGHFEDSKLYETLDARVIREGKEKEIMIAAQIAKRCLNFDGRKRPTMKEVAAELETLRSSLKHGLARTQSTISCFELNESEFSSIDISSDDY